MAIYVGNLSYEVTEEESTAVCAKYGTVKSVYLLTDRETDRLRGFGVCINGIERVAGVHHTIGNLKVLTCIQKFHI